MEILLNKSACKLPKNKSTAENLVFAFNQSPEMLEIFL
jgi:hypothetical protein